MKEKNQFNCPVEATLSLIGGKYKPLILWHLINQPLHYMELQRLIPKATPKMLSQQLHDLEDCGMIHREVIPEKPPKTIYSLTTFGQSIIPLLDAMCQWGTNYLEGLCMTANAIASRCFMPREYWENNFLSRYGKPTSSNAPLIAFAFLILRSSAKIRRFSVPVKLG